MVLIKSFLILLSRCQKTEAVKPTNERFPSFGGDGGGGENGDTCDTMYVRMRTVYSSLFVFIALMDLLATRIYSTDTQQSLAISTAMATVFCFESNTLSGNEREEAEEGKKNLISDIISVHTSSSLGSVSSI